MRATTPVEGMAMGARRWVYVGSGVGKVPSEVEKAAIGTACERFIANASLPPALSLGRTHTEAEESESPFTRLEYVSRDRFDISYRRHNDQWWRLHRSVTLNESLRLDEEDGLLHPL